MKKNLLKWVNKIVLLLSLVANIITLFMPLKVAEIGKQGTLISLMTSSIIPLNIVYFGAVALLLLVVSAVTTIVAIVSKKRGFFLAGVSNLLYGLIFYTLATNYTKGNTLLAFVGMGVALIAIVIQIVLTVKAGKEEEEYEESPMKQALPSLLIIVATLALLCISIFIPIYSYSNSVDTIVVTISETVFSAKTDYLVDIIVCSVLLLLYFFSIAYFLVVLSSFFYNKKQFVKKSKKMFLVFFIYSMVYFLAGFVLRFIMIVQKLSSTTISYIPLLMVVVLYFVYLILETLFNTKIQKELYESDEEKKKKKKGKWRPIIFVSILTVVTLLLLPLRIMNVDITLNGNSVLKKSFNGIELLMNPNAIGEGFEIFGFFTLLVVIVSVTLFLLSLSTAVTGNKSCNKVSKIACYVNLGLMSILGMSSLYFSISSALVSEAMQVFLKEASIPFSVDYEYVVQSDTIILFIVDVLTVVAFNIFEGLFRKYDEPILEVNGTLKMDPESMGAGIGGVAAKDNAPAFDEVKPNNQDPCQAFTNLDEVNADYEERLEELKKTSPDESFTLRDLTTYIIEYAAHDPKRLFYNDEQISTFLAGMGAFPARLSILQGMSGTGKTSLPKIVCKALKFECKTIEVESSWKDKNELLGYYNEFSKNYTPKKFTEAVYEAKLNPEIPYFIILDEMNLSRIEYYFSDFLSLMEGTEDERVIRLTNVKIFRRQDGEEIKYKALMNDRDLKICPNIWFIGTANRDESTFEISDKVYDRANVMNLNKRIDPKELSDDLEPLPEKFISYSQLNKMLAEAKKIKVFDVNNSPKIQACEEILKPFNISFGYRIKNQMRDFISIYVQCMCNPGEDQTSAIENALEDFLLSKVVRKLELKVIENKKELVDKFNKLGFAKCAEFIACLDVD